MSTEREDLSPASMTPKAPPAAPGILPYHIAVGLAAAAWGVVYLSLPPIVQFITRRLLGLSEASRFRSTIEFFLFEAPKVLMLLALVVFAVGIVRSFFTPERTRTMLAGRRELPGSLLAAGLGVVTPFCSCSAIPLFLGFVEAGIPLGVTFSFLIAAPMVNEVALGMLLALFGWRIALMYLLTGLLVAVGAGWTIGRMHMERHLEPWVLEIEMGGPWTAEKKLSWGDRIGAGIHAVIDIVGRIWVYVVLGIAAGAAIHGYVPTGVLASVMGRGSWWSVPGAVVIGIPMYSNAAGIVPVAQALMEKGAALGTVLAFMMSVIALSLPELIILRKVLRTRLIAVFVGVVAAGILIVGYLFNALL